MCMWCSSGAIHHASDSWDEAEI
eukprot:gene15879-biopygen17104